MVPRTLHQSLSCLAAAAAFASSAWAAAPSAAQDESSGARRGWLNWRGPDQAGTSPETALFDVPVLEGDGGAGEDAAAAGAVPGRVLWTYDLAGRGTPVVCDGRVFGLGYEGQGPELQEVLFCLDEATGEELWAHRYPDFLSDVVYSRYAIGSPTIDPETGHVFAMTVPGLLHAYTAEGELLWQVSMMETFGMLTFPNGRQGSPLIAGDLVVVHLVYASWGPFGPARDRFFAFDKSTGEAVWSAAPGITPLDNSFSMPVVEQRGGRTVLYAGLGCGNLGAVDVATGDALWRFQAATGGINSSALIHGDRLIAIHGVENVDSSVIGRMIALDLTKSPDEQGVLPPSAELWRNDLGAFSSSPVLVGDRVYATDATGILNAVDVETGRVLWHLRLGQSQIHASPVYADGKLYVPIAEGSFSVVRPSDEGPTLLGSVQLAGSCLGAPAVSGGRVLVHSTERLYCFGAETREAPPWPEPKAAIAPEVGAVARLQLVPFDQSVRAGEPVALSVRRLDARGNLIDVAPESEVAYAPSPLVTKGEDGKRIAAKPGTGMLKAEVGGLSATARLRVVPRLPYTEDFESIALDQGDGKFAYPPGEWFGGRAKWQIVDLDGERVARRDISNPMFQRTMSLFGHPGDSSYTVQADVMSEGSRRSLSSPGIVNQRYLVLLKGNHQMLEISSNVEHLKVSAPYEWRPNTWYTLKSRVDVGDDGVATVRAKVWVRGEPEPEAWTVEASDPHGHRNGAAGVYGFTPQSRFTVYIDNLSVTPNE